MMTGFNIAVLAAVIFSFGFPLGLMIWWKKKTGEKIWSFVAGALCFFVFAMVLENLLHQVCLINDNGISRVIMASPVLYTLYAAFAAGIFEETGRLFAFKVLLRKHEDNACAVAYGIGHGGIEVILIVGLNYLVLLLAMAGIDFGSEAANAQILALAHSIQLPVAAIAMFERLCAMMIHIGLSMLVFAAAREKKYFYLYPAAILLHALTDTPAALYQYQVFTNVLVVEGAALVMGIISMILGIRVLKARKQRMMTQPAIESEV